MKPNLNLDAENLPLENIYVSFSKAIELLHRRRQDPVLMQKVKDFFGEHMLPALADEPMIVYSRHITCPNFELENMWGQIWDSKMRVLFFETNTEFVTKNIEKLYESELNFADRATDNQDISQVISTEKIRLFEFNQYQGTLMHNIRSFNGELVIDIHHRAIQQSMPELYDRSKFVDCIDWYKQVRLLSDLKYEYFYSLFIVNSIFFESYDDLNPSESDFIKTTVLPAFYKVYDRFGVRPLIVSTVPRRYADLRYWYWFGHDKLNLYGSK